MCLFFKRIVFSALNPYLDKDHIILLGHHKFRENKRYPHAFKENAMEDKLMYIPIDSKLNYLL